MVMASGSGWSKRWLAIPVVAYAFVFALLGGAGVALWAMEGGGLPWAPEAEPAERDTALMRESAASGGMALRTFDDR